MNPSRRELLLDCMSYLWGISKKTEDYWEQVAALEWEEALSYFSSLLSHPTQLGMLFGQLSKDEFSKIQTTLQILCDRPRSQSPHFFEIMLWSSLIDIRSSVTRREVFRLALELDSLSRKLVGVSSEIRDEDLLHYQELAKRFISLSKHIHPAFSHSNHKHPQSLKKELATG